MNDNEWIVKGTVSVREESVEIKIGGEVYPASVFKKSVFFINVCPMFVVVTFSEIDQMLRGDNGAFDALANASDTGEEIEFNLSLGNRYGFGTEAKVYAGTKREDLISEAMNDFYKGETELQV